MQQFLAEVKHDNVPGGALEENGKFASGDLSPAQNELEQLKEGLNLYVDRLFVKFFEYGKENTDRTVDGASSSGEASGESSERRVDSKAFKDELLAYIDNIFNQINRFQVRGFQKIYEIYQLQ